MTDPISESLVGKIVDQTLSEREIVRAYVERSRNFQRSELAKREERCKLKMAQIRELLDKNR